MEEEEEVVVDNSNTTEEEVLETSNDDSNDESESVDELKARLAKAEELANNQKIRAEKAEKIAKGKTETQVTTQMSTRDLLALVSAGVHEEDIAEVEEYAKFKGISIAEAIKAPMVKTLLNEKQEVRKTAQATNTGNVRKGQAKVSGETLLAKARAGEAVADPEALAQAHFEEKMKRNK